MARFFDPSNKGDGKLHAPATARNKDYILDVLRDHLPDSGDILEFASGTGEHAAHMTKHLHPRNWHPSDLDPRHIDSINAWRLEVGQDNFKVPARIDASSQWTAPSNISAILAINLIHISPWFVCEGVIAGAGRNLTAGGMLYLYGPYKVDGHHTSDSNIAFDASLKSRDPSWGVRDMSDVTLLAEKHGFGDKRVIEMPANNFSLIFTKD